LSLDLPAVAIGGTLCDQRIWTPVLGHHDDAILVTAGQICGATAAQSDMVSYARAMLESLPERFILMGFSLGGLVALEMIAQAPERVAGLALVCAGAGAETDLGATQRRADNVEAITKGMARHARFDIWPRFNMQNDAALPDFIAMAEAVGTGLYRVQNELAISRLDSTSRIQDIAAPTLLISGGRDLLCPPGRLAAARTAMPNARHVSIANGGHLLAFEQPLQLAAILDDWLADTGLRPSNDRPRRDRSA
jgi:pimeloyl-ACP methyl ester carboxylesterase